MNTNAPIRRLTALLVLACATSACQPTPAPPSDPATAEADKPGSPAPVPAPPNEVPVPQPATPSQYTALGGADCELLKVDAEAGGSSKRCPGVGGYRLIVQDSDARMSLDVLPPQGDAQPLALWHLASGAFSSLGERAEWRLDDAGQPAALIVRYNAYLQPEQPDRATSYLVVAKLKPTPCIVEVVPAGANQNERAREAADAATGMTCRKPSGS